MKQHSRGLSFARRLLLVAVAILALAQPATAAIKANLEYPSQSFPASGIGNIQGWAFSTFSNATIDPLIEVKIDSEPSFYVPCCSTRQDVKQAYSTAPVHSGFSGVTNFQRLSEGSHTIAVTIRSSALEKKTIKSTFKVVKLSPWARLDSFRWKQSPKAQCESLEGLDPAYGNAGAVCNHSRAVSTHPKKLVTDCDGTIQFAFDRSRQTFAPITGCDPQGVVTPGGGGGTVGLVPNLPVLCLKNSVANLEISVEGLVPTFSFKTLLAAKVGVKIWEKGKVGQAIVAFGVGPKATQHEIKPFPLGSAIKPDTEYEYEITVTSNCSFAPDLKIMGPSSFSTKKRVVRAYIDKAKILEDGDNDFIWENHGEVAFNLRLSGDSAGVNGKNPSSYYKVAEGDVIQSPAKITWSPAPATFELQVYAGEYDPALTCSQVAFPGQVETCSGPLASGKLSFGTSLTAFGGTDEKILTLKKDNLKVKVWVRVVVTYE